MARRNKVFSNDVRILRIFRFQIRKYKLQTKLELMKVMLSDSDINKLEGFFEVFIDELLDRAFEVKEKVGTLESIKRTIQVCDRLLKPKNIEK